jgi:hypothetical protein
VAAAVRKAAFSAAAAEVLVGMAREESTQPQYPAPGHLAGQVDYRQPALNLGATAAVLASWDSVEAAAVGHLALVVAGLLAAEMAAAVVGTEATPLPTQAEEAAELSATGLAATVAPGFVVCGGLSNRGSKWNTRLSTTGWSKT